MLKSVCIVGFVFSLGGFGIFGHSARAASISATIATNVTGTEDLTADGTTDWAIYNYTANPISANKIAPASNKKVGVASVISSVSTLVGNPRGTGSSLPVLNYTYVDGTSPTILAPASPQGVLFDATLNNASAGFTFNITSGLAGHPEQAKLFLAGYGATPTLTVSLPGATTYTDSSVTYSTGVRPVTVYTINFTPDTTGDLLTVKYQTATSLDVNANADLQAVTVSSVPEPASIGFIGLAGAGLLLRRRGRAARSFN